MLCRGLSQRAVAVALVDSIIYGTACPQCMPLLATKPQPVPLNSLMGWYAVFYVTVPFSFGWPCHFFYICHINRHGKKEPHCVL